MSLTNPSAAEQSKFLQINKKSKGIHFVSLRFNLQWGTAPQGHRTQEHKGPVLVATPRVCLDQSRMRGALTPTDAPKRSALQRRFNSNTSNQMGTRQSRRRLASFQGRNTFVYNESERKASYELGNSVQITKRDDILVDGQAIRRISMNLRRLEVKLRVALALHHCQRRYGA
jgi:hypothetical protein